eukprot:gene15988-4839_t
MARFCPTTLHPPQKLQALYEGFPIPGLGPHCAHGEHEPILLAKWTRCSPCTLRPKSNVSQIRGCNAEIADTQKGLQDNRAAAAHQTRPRGASVEGEEWYTALCK